MAMSALSTNHEIGLRRSRGATAR